MKEAKKPQNAVERLISSLEIRIKAYQKTLEVIEKNYKEEKGWGLRRIADARLQLKALKRK